VRISLSDIKKYSLDEDKSKSLTLFDKYFYRPIANILVIPLYNNLKLTPNMISILSLIIAMIGFIFILLGNTQNVIIGLFCLILWAILDCADGCLARTLFYKFKITNPLGEFFDAFAGYGVVAFLWLSIGWTAFQNTGDVRLFLIGSLSSVLALFARVSYNKLLLVKLKRNPAIEDKDTRNSFLYNVYENLEFGSALLPLLLLSLYFDILNFFIILYFLINICMVLWFFKMVYLEANK
jgi:phosphatidylglycerophosphate synthase